MTQPFKDQIVLITGASMGIGREIALAFAEQGAQLVLAARSLAALEKVAQEAFQRGAECLVAKTDITKPAEVDALFEQIRQRHGRLDILVNNAGKGQYSLWKNAESATEEDVFRLNFFSLVELTRKALPLLRQSAGMRKIVNLSSIASYLAVPKMGLYCASKAALNAFSDTLRIELKPEGIGVLSVYPGIINTGFSANAANPGQEKVPEEYKTRGKGMDPRKLALKILQAIQRGKKREYVRLSNRLLIKSYQNLPSLVDWVMQRFT